METLFKNDTTNISITKTHLVVKHIGEDGVLIYYKYNIVSLLMILVNLVKEQPDENITGN